MNVHDHRPYDPVCNERRLPNGQLRGACLNDDGSTADPTTAARQAGKAAGWDEAHAKFCGWVQSFGWCQIHTNPNHPPHIPGA